MNNYQKYTKKYRAKNKKRAVEYLGSKCKKCGAKDNLEFDHIKRDSVSFRIGSYQLGLSWEIIKPELDKCQLLCKDCHLTKTNKELGRKTPVCGTASKYSNQKCRCDDCKKAWAESRREYLRNYRKQGASI